jgi:chromosome segregation ATPase
MSSKASRCWGRTTRNRAGKQAEGDPIELAKNFSRYIYLVFIVVLLVNNWSTGVKGRVVDQCRPTSRKYDTAVSVVLGRNIDSIIVDTEKTAIDCIEVYSFNVLMLRIELITFYY